ncbi:hypothetical protein B5M09_011942 [Aphanomyces astaci]|uniref:Uncharacterized protein n=1 Tax=Aphanomyces astaci TaxID=112090 RepID=A0A3R7YI35_APHAT|nr:hypothetical protein B5M09_011942 [Aphanomyces astaci]
MNLLAFVQVEELVRALPLVQHHEAAINVVHNLLQQRKSRHASARVIIEIILSRKLPPRWVTEVCMGYMSFTDTVPTLDKDVADTIDSILRLLRAYLDAPDSSQHDDWLAFQSVLDALPALVPLSSSAAFPILCQSNVAQGSRLLETCEPLIASTPSYFYFVIVFLRKSLVSPSPDLAITHLCHLLKSPATSAVQREDLASCLNDALYLSACRHLALCHVQLVPDVTPFDLGVRHCLSTLMELDSSSLLLHMDQVLFPRLHSVALYVTWHHTSTDVIVDPHPMPDLKLLQTRKPVKPHDVLTCILKLWPSLGPAAMGPHLWGVTTWKPVSHALLAQLDPLLDTQRHIGLSVAIAEYLLVLWTRFDPLLFGRVAFSGPRRVYRLVCQHVVSSPKLLASLLQLVWVDPTLLVARVGAVLQEAQSLSTLESPFHDVAAPTLTTDATRKVAYADALKQFEQRCCVANPPAAASIHDLVRLAKVAWHRPSVSYVHATRAMDAWLRVGKASLVQLMAPTDEDFVSQWSVVSAVVQTCVDVGVGWKQDPQRIWRGNDAAAVKRVIRTITTHVVEVADRPKRTKWTVHHPLPHTKRKRNTATPVRSRHPYIDDCLQQEESGDDAYADLEDFIVD